MKMKFHRILIGCFRSVLVLAMIPTNTHSLVVDTELTRAKAIMTSKQCFTCHSAWNAYTTTQFIRNGLVKPGNAVGSKIILNLKNFGGTMPKNALTLTDGEANELKNWVNGIKVTEANPVRIVSKKETQNVDIQKYYSCYAKLVDDIPKNDDALLLQVRNKTLTGSEACVELLKKANLESNGTLKTEGADYSPVGKTILKKMNDFHRSWFGAADMLVGIPSSECYRGTTELYYPGEMALHITNSLFGNNVPYSSIVTSDVSLEAIRVNTTEGEYGPRGEFRNGKHIYKAAGNATVETVWTPTKVQWGTMVGIKNMTAATVPKIWNGARDGIDYRSSTGGGVLGTNPYMLINSGRLIHETMDGGAKLHRRWSKAVFKDVLCREIPVVRTIDVVNKVEQNSNLTFRKGISCMQCHASIDEMAKVTRNKSLSSSSNFCNVTVNGLDSMHIYKHPVVEPAETYSTTDADPKFHQRPPNGEFYFRGYDGKLHDKNVNSEEELGQYISETDDLYVCAAKRYFQYFTGIDVPIYDAGDILNAPKLSPKLTEYQKFVHKLGLELKREQDLKLMFKKIFDSKAFIDPGVGVE